MKYAYFDSPLGSILLVEKGGSLCALSFVGQKYEFHPGPDWTEVPESPLLVRARQQLQEYFTGQRSRFDLPLSLAGTEFQCRVWHALAAIPAGKTVTYRALAESVGAARGVRAVAAAVGRNPISVVLPCHRVIGSDGSLTGYAGGLDRKKALLELEQAHHTGMEKVRAGIEPETPPDRGR
jgi:methylated-DNA-[protein]-cysteine S-methyltransferase